MKDITTEEDVKRMVDTFYDKVNQDELLAPIFNGVAQVEWTHHLAIMYQFWNQIVLDIPGYRGRPFPTHAKLPIRKEHFTRWLALFCANIDELFEGENTELVKERANNIAQVFQYKMGILTVEQL